MDLDAVIAHLTPEAKARLVMGSDFWHTAGVEPTPEHPGIAPIMVSDGPHGLRAQASEGGDHVGLLGAQVATCFPTASNLHASWNRDLAREVGVAIADEARALGVSVVLGPGMNIKRSPLCGRNFEYISEDPYLTGEQAVAYIEGVQSRNVGVSIKHFAANNQETERLRVDTLVDQRTLREIYFPAFEKAVVVTQPWTVMCSYNWLNGTRVAQDRWLLTQVLRDAWGFEGLVVSDWGAVFDRAASLSAGLDLQMPPGGQRAIDSVLTALASGELAMADLDASVRRVLELNLRGAEAATSGGEQKLTEHHELARRAAAQGCVLLTNDGLLPLAPERTVAVIGEFARTPRFQGGGSSQVTVGRVDTALEAWQAVRGEVAFAPGFSFDGPDQQLADEAVELARTADVVVLYVGLTDAEESEGADRVTMDLPAHQVSLIQAVCAVNPRTVVVLSNGSAVTMADWDQGPAAILEAWLGGQAIAGAVVDVLTGVVNPAGRLCETLPIRLEDNPSHGNFPGEDLQVRYGEGVLVGYRGYDHHRREVAYPFGFGLSYTSFGYSELSSQVTGSVANDDLLVTVAVTVTNTGDRAGADVVQLYLSDPEASVLRPPRELQGYQRVELEPGQSVRVEFSLGQRAFSFWSTRLGRWVVEAGEFLVAVGPNSRDLPLSAAIEVAAPSIAPPLSIDSSIIEWVQDPIGGPLLMARLTGGGEADSELAGALTSPALLTLVGNFPLERLTGFGMLPVSHADVLQLLEQYQAARGGQPG